MYKETPKRLTSDFSSEIMKDRIQWNNIFKIVGIVGGYQPRILYPATLSFRNEDMEKSYSEYDNMGSSNDLLPREIGENYFKTTIWKQS